MPSKLISGLFVSAIALAVIAPTAQAKLSSTPDSTPNYEMQNKYKLAGRAGAVSFGQDFSQIPGLNLSTQQESQLQEVRATMGNRLSEILSDEQLETFKKLMASGKSPRSMAASLSWGQMRKMRKLMNWQKEQLSSILDNDQMKLVEEFRKKRR